MSGHAPSRASLIGNAAVMLALLVLAAWLATLQRIDWPPLNPMIAPRIWAAITTGLFIALCAWSWRSARRQSGADATMEPRGGGWLLLHASQTGMAVEFAERTAAALSEAGHSAVVLDLARWNPAEHASGQCLFFASTTGEGDPPDAALGFAARVMSREFDLSRLRYAVLALGDRGYANFCAFGHQLDLWLQRQHAVPLFDLVEVDNADPAALRHWQHHIGRLAGTSAQADWSTPSYQPWTLSSRELMNPGSAGGPIHHITLSPPDHTLPLWQAGDIAEIGPRHAPRHVIEWMVAVGIPVETMVMDEGNRRKFSDLLSRSQLPAPASAAGLAPEAIAATLKPLPHREYSIASIPADARLDLVVRVMRNEAGRVGLGSGWLCEHAEMGSAIDLRIRRNPGFHGPEMPRPMILIGNGTGIAGLRAHLHERIRAGETRNWLLFGERNAGIDDLFGTELAAWLSKGRLAHLDRVYSRDGHAIRYVQDMLRTQGERLRAWVDDGAAIHVCGSLDGMAPGVHAVLVEVLGEARIASLLESGIYRRDVY